jgi:hypothetical protein
MTDIATIREIIANQHFTNVHGRDDRVARWITPNIIHKLDGSDTDCIKVMIAVSINNPAALGVVDWSQPLDLGAAHRAIAGWETEHGSAFRIKAYKPPMPPELKGMGLLDCLFTVVLPPMWERRAYLRPREGDTLGAYASRLTECHGIGTFLAGQNARYMKLAPPLNRAADRDTFVVPGPGSERGLNRLYDRPLNKKWPFGEFCAAVEKFRARLNEGLIAEGIEPVDAQDAQNVLCECDKLFRAIEKGGKVSRKYKPSSEPLPPAFDELPGTIAPVQQEAEAIPAYILNAAPPIVPLPKPGSANDADGYPSQGKSDPADDKHDPGKPVDFYIYEDARGRFYLGVERKLSSAGKKYFPQSHWNGQKWVSKLPPGFLKIPYRLPELLDAPTGTWVVIAAGEKDALTAVRLGFIATTNPGGEGKDQWTPELNKWFSGRKRVAIMEDNDKTGHAHAIEVAKALRGIVPDIRIVQFRELPEHGDLTDWIEADPARGHKELLARIESAKPAVGYELIKASTITPRIVRWLWPGHLACGELEILTGIPGIGKSQTHCFVIATVTAGRDWPDGAKGMPPRSIVMLTAEDNAAHTVIPRLIAAGADLDRVHILNRIRKDNRDRMFLLQEDIEELEQIIRNDPAIALVTIDPITAYLGGGKHFDSHRASDVRNQLGPLKDLAERTGVAFSAITHPAKRPGAKALDHYIGSQAFIAAPRLGHIAIPEFEEGSDGKPAATGRFLYATPKHNIYREMPTLAYKLIEASGGFDPEAEKEIQITRVEWCGEVGISADQALAAASPATKGRATASAVTFVLDVLASGLALRSAVIERAEERGFSEKQLRAAREKAGVLSRKEPRTAQTIWWWMKPEHEAAWRERFKQTARGAE